MLLQHNMNWYQIRNTMEIWIRFIHVCFYIHFTHGTLSDGTLNDGTLSDGTLSESHQDNCSYDENTKRFPRSSGTVFIVPDNADGTQDGDSVTLHCVVDIGSLISVTWTFNSNLITNGTTVVSNNQRLFILKSGSPPGSVQTYTLTINGVTRSDAGKYVCNAYQDIDESLSAEYDLLVDGMGPVTTLTSPTLISDDVTASKPRKVTYDTKADLVEEESEYTVSRDDDWYNSPLSSSSKSDNTFEVDVLATSTMTHDSPPQTTPCNGPSREEVFDLNIINTAIIAVAILSIICNLILGLAIVLQKRTDKYNTSDKESPQHHDGSDTDRPLGYEENSVYLQPMKNTTNTTKDEYQEIGNTDDNHQYAELM